jgi:hypothetical protein
MLSTMLFVLATQPPEKSLAETPKPAVYTVKPIRGDVLPPTLPKGYPFTVHGSPRTPPK